MQDTSIITISNKQTNKMKKKLDYCITHAEYLHKKLIWTIKDDFEKPKDWLGDKNYFKKLNEKELEQYVEDLIFADGFLNANEEEDK